MVLGVLGIRVSRGSAPRESCPPPLGLLGRVGILIRHLMRIMTCMYARLLAVNGVMFCKSRGASSPGVPFWKRWLQGLPAHGMR